MNHENENKGCLALLAFIGLPMLCLEGLRAGCTYLVKSYQTTRTTMQDLNKDGIQDVVHYNSFNKPFKVLFGTNDGAYLDKEQYVKRYAEQLEQRLEQSTSDALKGE